MDKLILIKKIFCFTPIALLFLFIFSIQSYGNGNDLCSGNQATIDCLMENAGKLYSTNNPLFWDILNKAAERAQDCKSPSDVTEFMRIVRIPRDGAFAEYFHEKIENLCISNSNCFFEALASMSKHDQISIIGILLNPLFADQSKITEVFYKNKGVKKYEQVVEFYLQKFQGKKLQDKK